MHAWQGGQAQRLIKAPCIHTAHNGQTKMAAKENQYIDSGRVYSRHYSMEHEGCLYNEHFTTCNTMTTSSNLARAGQMEIMKWDTDQFYFASFY